MQKQIEELKQSQLSQVLADGFAQLYHKKPKFPVSFLANYLKNYQQSKKELSNISIKLDENRVLIDKLNEDERLQRERLEVMRQKEQRSIEADEEQFKSKIYNTEYHQDILNQFCNWIQRKYKLTGVYIGEVKHQKKEVNLNENDQEDSHFDSDAPKLIYFENCSASQREIMFGKTLPLDSVLGKLLNEEVAGDEGEVGEEGQQKQVKAKDEVFFASVVNNKQLHFFRFPRLGSFFGIGVKIKSYLSDKLLDDNSERVSTYQKELSEYQKLREERQAKFRQGYEQRAGSGADQQELQSLQKQFEKEQQQFPKPQLKQFESIVREFVFGFDTLGQDREISKKDQSELRQYVNQLKNSWENTELNALRQDIDYHLKLIDKIEAPHQQTFSKILAEEDKEIITHEQADKVKDNQKLLELELDTLRLQKLKEYLHDDKYDPFLQEILRAKTLKYLQILKYWLIFTGKTKKQINYPGTNVLNYRGIKHMLSKEQFLNQINGYSSRGAKPEGLINNYAKWERIQRNLAKYEDVSVVAAYNIYIAFILRFLQLAAKVRKADRNKRVDIMVEQRKSRVARRRQNIRRIKQKEERLAAAIAQAEQKQEQFDKQAWQTQYNEIQDNQQVEIGPEILDEIDRDLENGEELFPEEEDVLENEGQAPVQPVE